MPLESDLSKISIAPPGDNGAVTPPAPAAVASPPPASEPDIAPAPPASAGGGFSLREIASQRGYDSTDFADEAALAAALFDRAEQYNQVQPIVEIGRQFAPYADKMGDFQAYMAAKEEDARVAAEDAAKAAAPPALNWRKAEYDPQWERFCEQDARTGMWQPLGGAPQFAAYAQKLNDVQEARRLNSQELVSDFPGLLDRYFAPRETSLKQTIIEEARKLVQEEFAQRQRESEAQAYIQQHAKDFYQQDAAGQLMVGSDGQPRLTPKGEAMAMHCQALAESGMSDPARIRQYAEIAVAADEAAGKFGAPVAPVAAPPVAVPAPAHEKKKLFLERVTKNQRSPQRGGSIPDDTAPAGTQQNPSADLGDVIRRVASQQGVQLQI